MTLTETATLTKRSLLGFGVFLVIAIISFISYQYYYYNFYLPNLKPPEILPDNRFGTLPKPNFIVNSLSSSNYSYSLDTQTGNLPTNLPKIIKVYFIPPLEASFLAPDRARTLALDLGFSNGPEILSPTQYKFTDTTNGQFIMDLNTGNFKYERIATDSGKLQETIDTQTKIADDFKSFLQSKNLLKDQIKSGHTQVTYDKTIQKDSQSATISLWQDNIDEFPVVTNKLTEGLIKGTVNKNTDKLLKYTKLDYIYWQIDKNSFGTYLLKTPQEAFSDLKNGAGNIVIEPKNPRVSITSIYLAYLLSEDYTPYLQPVYVFQGEQFASFIPAIQESK